MSGPGLRERAPSRVEVAMRGSNQSQKVPQCQLYVCTSCREKGSPREPEENRAGYRLYQALKGIPGELAHSTIRSRCDRHFASASVRVRAVSLCP